MKKRIIVFVSLFILTFNFFVSSNSEVLAKNNQHVLYKGIVTAQYLNVRKGPNKSSERAGSLKKGTVVSVLKSGNWLKIQYKNGQAYVSSEYVKRIYYSTTYMINAPIYRQFPQLPRGCCFCQYEIEPE